MRHGEITFLGEAEDAGMSNEAEPNDNQDEDSKPAAISSTVITNGYQITMTDIHAEFSGTVALRSGHTAWSEAELRSKLREDRAYLHTLDEKFLANYYNSEVRVGTKVSRLLHEIDAMVAKDPTSKCVVFSQYVPLLDVAAAELMARGVVFNRIDESMKQHERADALMNFTSNPNAKVFLLSMRNGSGLNLTVADHCFLMDVVQISSLEEQSIGRIHRLGQTRPVTVKRFVVEDTVEERLLGVRRALAIDRPTEGTQVDHSSTLSFDEDRPSKRARKEGQETYDDNAKRQQRIEMLEALFGHAGQEKTVHRA